MKLVVGKGISEAVCQVGPARAVCLRRRASRLLRIRRGGRLGFQWRESRISTVCCALAARLAGARVNPRLPCPTGRASYRRGWSDRPPRDPRLLFSAVVVEGVDKTTLPARGGPHSRHGTARNRLATSGWPGTATHSFVR